MKLLLSLQHYYAIASKATLLAPKDIPVPAAKFQDFFGLSYETALSEGLVYNAIDACTYLGVDAMGLDELWGSAKKVKLGGGFYCGIIGRGYWESHLYILYLLMCCCVLCRSGRKGPDIHLQCFLHVDAQ